MCASNWQRAKQKYNSVLLLRTLHEGSPYLSPQADTDADIDHPHLALQQKDELPFNQIGFMHWELVLRIRMLPCRYFGLDLNPKRDSIHRLRR